MCGCLSRTPYWGPGLQPRHVPWLGIELVTLWFTGWHSIHWATPAMAVFYRFFINFWILTPYQMYHWQLCSPIHSFSFCWWSPLLCKTFLVWCSPICLFFHFSHQKQYINKYCYEKCQIFYCFSSRVFMVLSLTFKSLIHFEFILVYGINWCSSLFCLHVSVQFSQLHLLKRLSLSHCMFLSPLSNVNQP